MKTNVLSAVILSMAMFVACGGDDGGIDAGGGSGSSSGSGSGGGSGSGHGSGSGSAVATVVKIDCGSGSADAEVTAKTFAYTSAPEGSGGPHSSDIPLNGIVKFNFSPATTHPVQPYAAGGTTDPGLRAPDGAVTCLKFTVAGTYHYDCSNHGTGGTGEPLHGIVNVQ